MANYAKNLPRDSGGAAMTFHPAPEVALQRYVSDNALVSSVVNLHPNTTQVEIGTQGGLGIVFRWVPKTESATQTPFASVVSSTPSLANYDHIIPANTTRQFVVPNETQGLPTGQAGSVNGLYQRIAWVVSGGSPASVRSAEY